MNGKSTKGAITISAIPPNWSSVHGGEGQVSTTIPTNTAANTSSAATMLNMYEPT